jgi:hypothetical protein
VSEDRVRIEAASGVGDQCPQRAEALPTSALARPMGGLVRVVVPSQAGRSELIDVHVRGRRRNRGLRCSRHGSLRGGRRGGSDSEMHRHRTAPLRERNGVTPWKRRVGDPNMHGEGAVAFSGYRTDSSAPDRARFRDRDRLVRHEATAGRLNSRSRRAGCHIQTRIWLRRRRLGRCPALWIGVLGRRLLLKRGRRRRGIHLRRRIPVDLLARTPTRTDLLPLGLRIRLLLLLHGLVGVHAGTGVGIYFRRLRTGTGARLRTTASRRSRLTDHLRCLSLLPPALKCGHCDGHKIRVPQEHAVPTLLHVPPRGR